MSNKQSSVEWLYNKIVIKLCNELQTLKYTHIFKDEIEKAKEMYREEHAQTWDKSMENFEARGMNKMRAYTDFDYYYNENFNP